MGGVTAILSQYRWEVSSMPMAAPRSLVHTSSRPPYCPSAWGVSETNLAVCTVECCCYGNPWMNSAETSCLGNPLSRCSIPPVRTTDSYPLTSEFTFARLHSQAFPNTCSQLSVVQVRMGRLFSFTICLSTTPYPEEDEHKPLIRCTRRCWRFNDTSRNMARGQTDRTGGESGENFCGPV